MPLNFTQLRHAMRVAAESAFAQVRATHPGERFYAFALYTDDGAMTVMPAANTEEGLRRSMGESASEANYYRWATAEWAYEASGEDAFQTAYDLLNVDDRYDEENPDAFAALQAQLIETMTLALGDLDAEGFFGTGTSREKVTLFVSISDSDDAEATENASARRLNPDSVYQRFLTRYQ